MMLWKRIGLVSSLLLGCVTPAAGSGAWSTFLRPYTYNDLLPLRDTVWCATQEAGLLRYLRSADRIESIVREPGGLASNRLTALAYDRSGRLWVGTLGAGASRLSADLSTWDLINAFDGLPSDSINVLQADRDTMWIGTPRGIALWNGREIAGALPDGVNPSPFLSDNITGIVVSGDSLWVSNAGGVQRSRLSQGLFSWTTANNGLPASTPVERLTSDGLSIMALANGTAYTLTAADTWQPTSNIGTVRRIVTDNGILVAATDLGLYRWVSNADWQLVTTNVHSINIPGGGLEVGSDPDGQLFAANSSGLFLPPYGPGDLRSPNTVPGNEVINVAVAGSRVYVNTFQEGTGRFDGTQWRDWYPGTCVVGCDTTFFNPTYAFALQMDRRGHLWVGCWGASIETFDDSVSPPQFTHQWVGDQLTQDKHTWAWAAAIDSNGGIWLGMDTSSLGSAGYEPQCLDYYDASGLYRHNFQPLNTSLLRGILVHGLSVDKNGVVWVGYSGQGVDRFRPDTTAAVFDPTSWAHVPGTDNLDVRGIVAHGDSIWVLTTADLRLYSRLTPAASPRVYTLAAAPAQLGVRQIDVAPDGAVWVATTGGVRVYRTDGTIQDFTASNSPLADNDARAVAVDRVTGALWMGTAFGLNRYEPNYTAPPAPILPQLRIKIYPNPALLTGLGVQLSLSGNASSYSGSVFDLDGRAVRQFSVSANGRVFWDGRDQDGSLVKPGIYFVRVEGGGKSAVARIALLH